MIHLPSPTTIEVDIESVRKTTALTLALGVSSTLVLVVSHLELTDIRLGEGDHRLEWTILQVGAFVIIAFHVATFVTLRRGRRFLDGRAQVDLVVPVKQTVTYRASFGHVELFQEYRKPLRSK